MGYFDVILLLALPQAHRQTIHLNLDRRSQDSTPLVAGCKNKIRSEWASVSNSRDERSQIDSGGGDCRLDCAGSCLGSDSVDVSSRSHIYYMCCGLHYGLTGFQ